MSEKFEQERLLIARKICDLREKSGYSLRGMARELEMDATQYSRLERGDTDFRVSSLFRIARFHKVPASYLFDDISFAPTED